MFIANFAQQASSWTYPGLNQRAATGQLAARMSSAWGRHTLKYGVEERRYHYATVIPGGNPTGSYTFDNTYLRQADNTPASSVSNTGVAWASFLMGLPGSMSIDTNDTGYFSTPYHAAYLQDDLRVTGKLRLGFGLRFEREGGTSERFNRGLTGAYDFSFVPPYAAAAQSAYAATLADPANASNAGVQLLKQNMPSLSVAGGVSYLGQNYDNLSAGTNRFLPNASMVYQFNSKTVLRIGAGMYGDTYNALSATNSRPNQIGYNQNQAATLTNDLGLTFIGSGAAANMGAANPMTDPFPVLSSGSRWILPFGSTLGSNVLDGQAFTYTPRDYKPTWNGRWKVSLQREIHGNHMIDVSYNGSYASVPFQQNLSYLPAQYWNFTMSRNTAVDSAMTAAVANPFKAALASLQTSNPTLYNYLSTKSTFTANTLQVQQLLRAYPNAASNLQKMDAMRGKVMYNDAQFMYQKRFSSGFQSSVMYTRSWARQQWLPNQFDQTPAWQPNSSSRPNRFVFTTVWKLPFGKGERLLTHGPLQHLAGGWQLSWICQYQTGALIDWGNLFYYGTVDQVVQKLNQSATHDANIHMWYSPSAIYTGTTAVPADFVGFEGRSSAQPGPYQARMFPQFVDALRADSIRNWDVKIYRRINLYERLNMNISADLLNLTNHTQFAGPNITPTSKDFGKMTVAVNQPRFIQLNIRFDF